MIVPFFRWKLDLSFFLRCDKIPSFFGIFFHQISDIFSTHNSIFEKWGKVGKVCLQMFRNFEVASNVTRQRSTLNILHEPFFTERSLIGEVCSKMIFFTVASVRYNSHQSHSHISIILYPFCWIYSLHIWFCSFFYPSGNLVVSQGRASFLI